MKYLFIMSESADVVSEGITDYCTSKIRMEQGVDGSRGANFEKHATGTDQE